MLNIHKLFTRLLQIIILFTILTLLVSCASQYRTHDDGLDYDPINNTIDYNAILDYFGTADYNN